jgi:hypothetical protein
MHQVTDTIAGMVGVYASQKLNSDVVNIFMTILVSASETVAATNKRIQWQLCICD